MAKAPNSEYDRNPSAVTLGLALSMAWQLGIVVLVPITGGHFIDSKFDTGNVAIIIGLFLASTGMIVVVQQTIKQLNLAMKPKSPKESDD